MKLIIIILTLGLLTFKVNAQSYFNGRFQKFERSTAGHRYIFYDFDRTGSLMKVKYFAQNAYSQYLSWRSGKTILLVTAGAFSDSFEPNGRPVGLCVDNGVIVNRSADQVMDGMVIIYNGGDQIGGIAIVDMDINPVTVNGTDRYYPRTSETDKSRFLAWGEGQGVTLFQTQLVYSSDRTVHFPASRLYYGDQRERRFLATCRKSGVLHHVVIDAPDALELNLSASYAKRLLTENGYEEVIYILNLDTGCKNVLFVYDSSGLRDLRPGAVGCGERANINAATNLLVYYTE